MPERGRVTGDLLCGMGIYLGMNRRLVTALAIRGIDYRRKPAEVGTAM